MTISIERYLTLGDVADIGEYIIVRKEIPAWNDYDTTVYNKNTGEVKKSFWYEKESKLFYQNNINNKEGFVLLIERGGDTSVTMMWEGSEDYSKGGINTALDKITNYAGSMWKSYCIAMPTNGEEQVVFKLRIGNGGKYILSKNYAGFREVGYVHVLNLRAGSEFVFSVTEKGIYLVVRSVTSSTVSREVFKLAEKCSNGKWVDLETEKRLMDGTEKSGAINSVGKVDMEWFTEVQFGG
jgi:hypothetical protein